MVGFPIFEKLICIDRLAHTHTLPNIVLSADG